MIEQPEWTEAAYQMSITSRCWYRTPYETTPRSIADWSTIRNSPELRAIYEEEVALGTVPSWAEEIVDRMVKYLPTCGHYTFPESIWQIGQAIRNGHCPALVYSCFTADPGRKRLMSYYVYCLDAWLKEAPLETATAELSMREDLGKDWPKIIAGIYHALGARTVTVAEPGVEDVVQHMQVYTSDASFATAVPQHEQGVTRLFS